MFCVTSTHSVGCTFLDWSIHWLAGKDQYYALDQEIWIPLVKNPVTKINAHLHQRNHPSTKDTLAVFIARAQDKFCSAYLSPPRGYELVSQLGLTENNLTSKSGQKIFYNTMYSEYTNSVQHCLDSNVPVVFVHSSTQPRGYYWSPRNQGKNLFNDQPFDTLEQNQEFYNQLFYKKSDIETAWDKREMLALGLRPYDTDIFQSVGWADQHLRIDCQQLWHDTQHCVTEIMEYLNIPLASDRMRSWLPVAQQWQQIQIRQLNFGWQVDDIVNCIVNGWYRSLPNLTLTEEAIIQHLLIYRHGLNLKTWQLEKFPNNTQQLHQLLEPNIHPVPRIY